MSDDEDMNPEELVDFIDIAKYASEVKVQVTPSRMLEITAPWYTRDKDEVLWSSPTERAIIEDDFEAFVQILTIAHSLPNYPLRHNLILDQLLTYDRPAMLDEFIRQTGEGIDLSTQGRSIDDKTSHETSSKAYLGLNVHGKKRKDLATKGDPNAPQTYRNDVIPLVWIALKNRLSATVRYLASEQPLAAYRFYASSHGDRIAKSLRQIPDLAASLPALLGWAPNAVNETPLTAAVLSCQADMVEMLYTLRPKETREQSSLR